MRLLFRVMPAKWLSISFFILKLSGLNFHKFFIKICGIVITSRRGNSMVWFASLLKNTTSLDSNFKTIWAIKELRLRGPSSFLSIISTRSWTLRQFSGLQLRSPPSVFKRNACIYHDITRWNLSTYGNC